MIIAINHGLCIKKEEKKSRHFLMVGYKMCWLIRACSKTNCTLCTNDLFATKNPCQNHEFESTAKLLPISKTLENV